MSVFPSDSIKGTTARSEALYNSFKAYPGNTKGKYLGDPRYGVEPCSAEVWWVLQNAEPLIDD